MRFWVLPLFAAAVLLAAPAFLSAPAQAADCKALIDEINMKLEPDVIPMLYPTQWDDIKFAREWGVPACDAGKNDEAVELLMEAKKVIDSEIKRSYDLSTLETKGADRNTVTVGASEFPSKDLAARKHFKD